MIDVGPPPPTTKKTTYATNSPIHGENEIDLHVNTSFQITNTEQLSPDDEIQNKHSYDAMSTTQKNNNTDCANFSLENCQSTVADVHASICKKLAYPRELQPENFHHVLLLLSLEVRLNILRKNQSYPMLWENQLWSNLHQHASVLDRKSVFKL